MSDELQPQGELVRSPVARDVREDDTLSDLDAIDAPTVADEPDASRGPHMTGISESEYNMAKAALSIVQMVRQVLASKVENEQDRWSFMQQQLRAHEVQIWDQLAKKSGFGSVEEAQMAGMTFKLKTGHFVETVEAAAPVAATDEPDAKKA